MPVVGRREMDAIVVANVPLCREHFRIDIRVHQFKPTEPGEFVQLKCSPASGDSTAEAALHSSCDGNPDFGPNANPAVATGDETLPWPQICDSDLLTRQAFLRRPFSLAGRRDTADGVFLSVIYRTVGVGTDWLATLKPGDAINLIGPMGNRFPKPPSGFGIFVGGGVGIPPLLYLAQRWRSTRMLAFCGSTTRDLLPLTIQSDPASSDAPAPTMGIGDVSSSSISPSPTDAPAPTMIIAELAEFGVASVISTDDGSFGFHGLVTEALDRFLAATLPSLPTEQRPILYTCGPEGMMNRVAAIAAGHGLDCYAAVERAMACGMATCQSCVIRVRNGNRDGRGNRTSDGPAESWRYALSCTEGPVFKSCDLLW